MELTIQIPWLSRMRRIAIGLSLVLVLVALALPASAAPPEGVSGEVTVVNDETNPVPVTVENEVAVTGGNNTPVNVSGEVNATVQGAVDVNGQTYDEDSNLNVNVAATLTAVVQGAGGFREVLRGYNFEDPPQNLSTLTISPLFGEGFGGAPKSTEPDEVLGIRIIIDGALRYNLQVTGADLPFSLTFPVPIGNVSRVVVDCLETGSDAECAAHVGLSGY